MRIDIITIFPDFFSNFFNYSIINRAQKNNIVELHIHNLRDYSDNKQRSVDDYQYGGGAGMVMTIQPIDKCINTLKSQRDYDEIIFLSPDGHTLNQKICNKLSINENLILLCGHYKGIDQRIRDIHITKEISIGDYVLTGGEAAAAILVDAVVRLIPGVISDETSALTDSFQDNLLAPPIYTRPSNFNGHKVPDILLSGNEQKINTWRDEESVRKTKENRPDLLEE
ncbi:MAG: tRNA (guanosine(37)-N1)-methyltransferase TrmD [Flavobacteriales bacterium]|nr:tRNA (guanosine(37)-N1)-methyltransferase TrmD [Flavobacteriales bacterium]MDG1426220.1 tRNA (guanosine(37)-N1)-methyltransferase TrmD [Flavobacteriales bacterium]MDG1934085.1 tRNA (guanosine(37)-N1)-methyltransferase TrmD [Flavobacteriales bacterium]|tara:strand:+ start:409 stop:1086 length:678 start_codon:yes stop_codon:yes gene_type:complete